MNTTISLPRDLRDELARLTSELGETSMAETLRVLIFHFEAVRAWDRLEADPEEMAAYIAEAQELANAGLDAIEDWVWE